MITSLNDWKNRKINENNSDGTENPLNDPKYWDTYISNTWDHISKKTANFGVPKDQFLENPEIWIRTAFKNAEYDGKLSERDVQVIKKEAIKYLENNERINMGVLQAMIFQLSVDENKTNENVDSLQVILTSFRKDIKEASNDTHDIVSAYEEVIDTYKQKYPQFTNEIDAEWDKMCVEAEKEMDDLKNKNISNNESKKPKHLTDEYIKTSLDKYKKFVSTISGKQLSFLSAVKFWKEGGAKTGDMDAIAYSLFIPKKLGSKLAEVLSMVTRKGKEEAYEYAKSLDTSIKETLNNESDDFTDEEIALLFNAEFDQAYPNSYFYDDITIQKDNGIVYLFTSEEGERIATDGVQDALNRIDNENENVITNEALSEKSIQKKVDEINDMISKAKDDDGDPIGVIDTSGTWEEPMVYKPLVYKNGALYIEYTQPYRPGKVNKEKITKANMEFDGIPTLNDIAKWYRKAIKKAGKPVNENMETTDVNKYSALATKIMDAVSAIKPLNFTKEELDEVAKYYDVFGDDDGTEVELPDNYGSEEWFANCPHQDKIIIASDDFLLKLRAAVPEIAELSDDQIDNLVYHLWFTPSFTNDGLPYGTEHKHLTKNLAKILQPTEESLTNEHAGTSSDFTEDEIKQITDIRPMTLNEIGIYEFAGGEFCLIKHHDESIAMFRYNDQTSQFNEFKHYDTLALLLEDLKDDKFQAHNTNEKSTPGTASEFTEDELNHLGAKLKVTIGNENGLPTFEKDGKFAMIKHADGVIELLKFDDATSEYKEYKTFSDFEDFLLSSDPINETIIEAKVEKVNATITLNYMANINHMVKAVNKYLPKDKKVKIKDFPNIESFEEIDSFDIDDVYPEVKKILNKKGYTFTSIRKKGEDGFKFTLKSKVVKESNEVQTESSIFEFTSADVLFDDQKDYILYDLEEILKMLNITEENFHELVMFSKEDALLQGKESELFKFISMVRALYTPVLTIENNFVYDVNGVKVWISDINANLCIYINNNDLGSFNEQLINII